MGNCIKKYFGFTMAETILVMVILGIIATIMLSSLKPSRFKEQGLEVLAKDVYGGIDTALDLVLANYSPHSTFDEIYSPDKTVLSEDFTSQKHSYYIAEEMKNYLSLSRENKACTASDSALFSYCYNEVDGMKNAFYLKKGGWIKVVYSRNKMNVVVPPASNSVTMKDCNLYILLDTNGNKKPNSLGKDRFIIPLFNEGVYILRSYKSEHKCEAGKFWFDNIANADTGVLGGCKFCTYGFYCPDGYSMYECPRGYTTATNSAKKLEDCSKVARCERGEVYSRNVNKCISCPRGSYCDGESSNAISNFYNFTNAEGVLATNPMDFTVKIKCPPGQKQIQKQAVA